MLGIEIVNYVTFAAKPFFYSENILSFCFKQVKRFPDQKWFDYHRSFTSL
ncbi:hypothetical protein Daudx_1047 [Candidatus Desulforudis audaxviator]|nr:hypothetical protein Daudx_1047 [Candidatus Desulforudis audaxviator]